MSSATLQDQMGAKALIDQMRHRTMQVQEHLDLPKRREEVKARLQEHYRRQGIAVDEELIERGVREFFKDRLAFEAPAVSRLQATLARLYIGRDDLVRRWGWPSGMAAAALLGTALLLYGGGLVVETNVTHRLQGEVLRLQEALRVADAWITEIEGHRESLTAVANDLPAVGRYLADMELATKAARKKVESVSGQLPGEVTPGNRAMADAAVKTGAGLLRQIQADLEPGNRALQTIQKLLSLEDRLRQLVQNEAWAAARTRFPELARAESSARAALAAGDAPQAEERIAHLSARLRNAADLDELDERLRRLRAGFAALKLTPAEQQQVAAMAAHVTSAIDRHDLGAANEALREMDGRLEFARMPIKLVIHAGKPSIVERSFQKQGKSYFAIVVATDPAGNPAPMHITSAETGSTRRVSRFGVRVPPEVFERIKQDKLADGHVDDALLASKPAESLTFDYRMPVAGRPDFILEW